MIFLAPVTLPATTALVLAQQPGNGDNGGQGEDFGKSSPVGFLLLLIFLIAVAFLVRSMTKHLKRVPASFDPDEAAELEKAAKAPEEGEQPATTDEPEAQAPEREKSEKS
ncbi:MAG TPA: hypothetical protein VJ870_19735 [Amycolatopsis sp.]|nr:hypothetical protein [Amycolatopsis sp.]